MKDNYDVIIVGGGPGGTSAAVAAAKEGVSVLLIERYGFLGGMATAGLVNPFMPYRLKDKCLTSSVFNELIERLEKAGALDKDTITFDDEMMKYVLDRMMADHGVDVLFHSLFADVDCSGEMIRSIALEGKSGRKCFEGKIFIDSTGDGDVAARAGATVEFGSPQDGVCQPMTLCFRIGGISGSLSHQDLGKELTDILLDAKKSGDVDQPREDILVFSTLIEGIYHFNTTRIVRKDGTDTLQLTDAEVEGRRQVIELFNLFKERSPHFANAHLLKMACQIGTRESRRIMGKYVITEKDVLEARKFEDGIARSNYPIDIHNPVGTGTVIKFLPPDDYYEVPYRCLVPKGINNLLIGSRCVSATHEAHGSLRIIPVVSGMGEAAGIAAAKCVLDDLRPSEIKGDEIKKQLFG